MVEGVEVLHDVQVHNVKRFWVLNPTSMAYSFAWEAVDAATPGSPASPFHCSTMTGVLAAGKRYEMVFQYTPSEDKLQVVPAALLTAVTYGHSHLDMSSLNACPDCQLLSVLCGRIVTTPIQGPSHPQLNFLCVLHDMPCSSPPRACAQSLPMGPAGVILEV